MAMKNPELGKIYEDPDGSRWLKYFFRFEDDTIKQYWRRECLQDIMIDIGKDVYLGFERHAFNNLFPKLPFGSIDQEELLAEIRMWAIEAADEYKGGQGGRMEDDAVTFESWLSGHLRYKSRIYLNNAWLKQNHPEGKSVIRISVLEDTDFDNNESYQLTDTYSVRSTHSLEMSEFLDSLSEESKEILERLTRRDEQSFEDILYAITKVYYANAVAKLAEIPASRIEQLVSEMVEKAPKYLCDLHYGS